MPMGTISFEKYLNQLDTLIQQVEKESDEEKLLVKWLKIYRITSDASQLKNLESNKLLVLKKIQQRFNQEIAPILVRFRKVYGHSSMRDYLDHYTQRFFQQVDEAEKNMKILPLYALEILEDLLFFVNLYSFRLQATEIPRMLKEKIKQKIRILLKDFEVEGGSKTLIQDQAKITEGLKNTLQKTTIPSVQENKSIGEANVDSPVGTKSTEDSDIMLNQLIYPEEPTKEEIQNRNLIDPETRIQSPLNQTIPTDSNIISPELESTVKGPNSAIMDVFPYSTWVPYTEWANFTKYRYCPDCGRIIHPENMTCTGCQKKY